MSLRQRFLDQEAMKESSLSRAFEAMEKHACGAITAWRDERTYAANRQKQEELKGLLLKLGFGVTKVSGFYIENYKPPDYEWGKNLKSDALEEIPVKEPAFWVVNTTVDGDDNNELEKVLKQLGEEYDQDAILSIPFGNSGKLIGTKEGAWPFKDVEIPYSKREFGVKAKYATLINNRPFSLVEGKAEVQFAPNNVYGRMAWSEAANRKLRELNLI